MALFIDGFKMQLDHCELMGLWEGKAHLVKGSGLLGKPVEGAPPPSSLSYCYLCFLATMRCTTLPRTTLPPWQQQIRPIWGGKVLHQEPNKAISL